MNDRYVILKHATPPGYARPLHWDLMLEDDGVLLTWALASEPLTGGSTAAEQLAPHRLAYLDFEGEVSGGRGVVQRFDAGRFQWIKRRDDFIRIQLAGKVLSGHVTLQRQGEHWRATFSDG